MHAVMVTAAALALFTLTDLFAEGEVGCRPCDAGGCVLGGHALCSYTVHS